MFPVIPLELFICEFMSSSYAWNVCNYSVFARRSRLHVSATFHIPIYIVTAEKTMEHRDLHLYPVSLCSIQMSEHGEESLGSGFRLGNTSIKTTPPLRCFAPAVILHNVDAMLWHPLFLLCVLIYIYIQAARCNSGSNKTCRRGSYLCVSWV